MQWKMIENIFLTGPLHDIGKVGIPDYVLLKPAPVLTDLNMPEISGIELTEKIRKKYSSDELPVIMVTTQSDVQDHESAAAGVNNILIKPFNADSLRDAMGKYIQF